MAGKYGPNNLGHGYIKSFGSFAYLYLEVSGDEIGDGAIVTTQVNLYDPTEPSTLEINGQNLTVSYYDTIECLVVYRQNQTFAPLSDVNVRTYSGRIYENGTEKWHGIYSIWQKPTTLTETRYP